MALITDREREICEDLDWRILDSDDEGVELESWSPAGEDFIISIQPDETLYEGVKRNLDEFNVDDHVELWIGQRGKDGVPETVQELLEDAVAIKGMLQELEKKLTVFQNSQNLKNIKTGDIIEFGKYPYHEDGSKEPVEWQVLDKKKDKILVISKYGLDVKRYHEKWKDVTWDTCSLRQWLNHEFMDAAFTDEEKQNVVLSHVFADPNPKYDTNPGNDTDDYIFLLSVKESNKRMNFQNKKERCIFVTPYVAQKDLLYYGGECCWWLRSPGERRDHAAEIKRDGIISYDGGIVSNDYAAVRPAMWLKIDD